MEGFNRQLPDSFLPQPSPECGRLLFLLFYWSGCGNGFHRQIIKIHRTTSILISRIIISRSYNTKVLLILCRYFYIVWARFLSATWLNCSTCFPEVQRNGFISWNIKFVVKCFVHLCIQVLKNLYTLLLKIIGLLKFPIQSFFVIAKFLHKNVMVMCCRNNRFLFVNQHRLTIINWSYLSGFSSISWYHNRQYDHYY